MRLEAGAASAPLCQWQHEGGRCAAVLHEVFSWLTGEELARASATCRAWRRAAAAPALWRRLLLRRIDGSLHATLSVSWRQEYVDACAGWRLETRVPVAGALYASLAPSGTRLVLLADDATVAIWERATEGSPPQTPQWRSLWSAALREARGWRSAVRAHWSPSGARLLLAGELALADSWELLVVDVDEDGRGHMSSRARCSPGAAGCWVDAAGEAFLSLELSVFAPKIACTTVWLNASTQETQSEYAGVTAPLLRIYNEDKSHITFAAVVHVPLDTDDENVDTEEHDYSRAIQKKLATVTLGMLVTVSGCQSDAGGALCAWPLNALRPPPVVAATLGNLRERVRRRATAPTPAPAPDPAPPDEASVRAICEPPEHVCALPVPPVGFVVNPSGRCVWLTLCDDSAWCSSLPMLRPLRRLSLAPSIAPLHALLSLHYVQPAISDLYFVSPCVSQRGAVCAWSVRSGARATPPPSLPPPPPPSPREGAVCALVTMFPPRGPPAISDSSTTGTELLVLTKDDLYVIRRPDVRVESYRQVSRSCDGPQVRPPPACMSAERPACRPRPAAAETRGVRVVCCAPPQGCRPPCAPPPAAPPLSCADRSSSSRVVGCGGPSQGNQSSRRCGASRDRVACRLAAAKDLRRSDYEREVAERLPAPPAPPVTFKLGEDRMCSRATDGREYQLPCPPGPTPRCGPNRSPPPPRCVPLRPDDACRISDGQSDPCAHRPRVFVEIDRSATTSPAPAPAPEPAPASSPVPVSSCGQNETSATSRSLTSRIIDGLGRGRKPTGSGTTFGDSRRDRRLHTAVAVPETSKSEVCDAKKEHTGLADVLRERSNFAEAGRGRMALRCSVSASDPAPATGRLELPVPRGAERVTVCVALAGAAAPTPSLADGGPRDAPCSPSGGKDSWLSIKTIQKRFASCRRGDEADRGQGPCSPKQNGPCPSQKPSPHPSHKTMPGPSHKPKPSPSQKPQSPGLAKKPKYPTNIQKCSSTLSVGDTFLVKL